MHTRSPVRLQASQPVRQLLRRIQGLQPRLPDAVSRAAGGGMLACTCCNIPCCCWGGTLAGMLSSFQMFSRTSGSICTLHSTMHGG